MTYNEYWQVIDAGIAPDELVTFKYEDQGVATLEDGLYVLEENLEDPAFVDKMTRFVRASMKGWKWAEENPEEAAMIVLENDETGAQTEAHQIRMMGEVAKLTAGSNGALDPGRLRAHGGDAAHRGRLGPGDHAPTDASPRAPGPAPARLGITGPLPGPRRPATWRRWSRRFSVLPARCPTGWSS
jgi:hypothetical protein